MANVYTYGDSIAAGNLASTAANRFANQVATAKSWTLTNNGISGAQILGMVDTIYAKTVAQTDKFIPLLGYNDMRYGGTDADALATFQNALYALAAWVALPSGNKFNARNLSEVSYAGTWDNNGTTYGGSMSRYATAIGSTATFTLTGPVAYVGLTRTSYANGAGTVTVDGVLKASFSATGLVESAAGREWGPFLVRLTGLGDGAHTIVVEQTGGVGLEHIYLDWAGSPLGAADATGPDVYIGNCLYMNATGYAISPNAGSDAAVDAYNAAIQTVVTNLRADGLRVALADANSYYNPATAGDTDADNIHPTNQGHTKIANAFLAAISAGFPKVYNLLRGVGRFIKSGNSILAT